MLVDWKSQA